VQRVDNVIVIRNGNMTRREKRVRRKGRNMWIDDRK
jgi:hypothetical protein